MQYVPWRRIANWKCTSCGDCCRLYSVVINFQEWLGIVSNYGAECTVSGANKLFINRKNDGSCAFLNNGSRIGLCGLQHMKPRACQLWPFKVSSEPHYGYQNEALYFYYGKPLFVYADPMCKGLTVGKPTLEFVSLILPEFVEIAAGIRTNQFRTTGGPWHPHLSPSFGLENVSNWL